MPIPKLLATCLLAGVLPAVPCWAWCCCLGEYLRVAPTLRGVWSALILVVFTVVGWRLSIGLGYEYGQPVPPMWRRARWALGALLAWRITQRRV